MFAGKASTTPLIRAGTTSGTNPRARFPANRLHGNSEDDLLRYQVAQVQGVSPEKLHIEIIGTQFHVMTRLFKIHDGAQFDIDLFLDLEIKILETTGTPHPYLPGDMTAHQELKTDFSYVKGTGNRSLDIQFPDRRIFPIQPDLNIDALREDIIEEELHPHPPKPRHEKYRMNGPLSM